MKLLMSGYYGFGNLGDEALLAGMIEVLMERGHQLTVLSHDPRLTRSLHGVGAVPRVGGLTAALWRSDALISGGGGLLQDRTSRRSLRYYLGVLRLARLLGKKAVVYGQSVGPLSPAGRRAVRGALAGLPVAVRDEASRELLAGLGLPAHLTADAALLLCAPAAALVENAVLLIPRGGFPDLTPCLAEVASLLLADGRPVLAAALQEDEDGPEVEVLLRRAVGVRRLWFGTPQEALAGIGAAGYVISARLHGLILAAVAGRGMSGIVYDRKVASFLAEVGAPAHPLSPDPAQLYREARARAKPDRERVGRLIARARDGLDWLDGVLACGAQGA